MATTWQRNLQWVEYFRLVILKIPNVQFGSVFLKPVANMTHLLNQIQSRMHTMLIKSPVKSSTTKTIFDYYTWCSRDYIRGFLWGINLYVVRVYTDYVVTEDHYHKEWHSSNSNSISSTHRGGHWLTSIIECSSYR